MNSRQMNGSGGDHQQKYLQLESHSRSFNRLVRVQVDLHEHPMVHLSLPNLYTCGACKEFGAGKRLSCQSCRYDVHEFCGGILKSKCDVCGKASKGCTYRCSATGCSYQLHPTCAMLSPKTEFPGHPNHPLILSPPDAAAARSKPCGECKRRRPGGHVYTCTVPSCDYGLHASCAKSMVNGLHAHGFKGVDVDQKDRSSTVLGAAARIASHVVIGFIGGLVEGIGEGVGDALTQNIVSRGGGGPGPWPSRSSSSRSPMGRRRPFVN
ncbi:hypothetical protein V2J09_017271 [Rumex salicifolius]